MLIFYLNVHVPCWRTIKYYPKKTWFLFYTDANLFFRLNEITQLLYVRTEYIAMG